MTESPPIVKFAFAGRDAARYREDVEIWKRDHEAPGGDPWPWVRLVEDANRLFALLTAVDLDARKAARSGSLSADEYTRIDAELESLFLGWLASSKRIEPDVRRLLGGHGAVGEWETFLGRVREVECMSAGDEGLLANDAMIELRDAAVDALRRGDVEPLFDDVRS